MQQQKIVAIILVILVLLAVVIGLIVTAFYTDNFTHSFAYVYLTSGNQRIMQDSTVSLGDGYFEVHVLNNCEWDVEILPAGEDFSYVVDREIYSWLSITNLDKVFQLVKLDVRFSVRCRDVTVQDVMNEMYPGKNVVCPVDTTDEAHFKLVVTTSEGKSITLTFRCIISVDSVEVDLPAIIF